MSSGIIRGSYYAAGLAVVGLLAWMTSQQLGASPKIRADVDGGAPIASGAATAAAPDAGTANAGSVTETSSDGGVHAMALGDADGGLSLTALLGDGGNAMPSGAPRSVRIGLVLVQYAGAEGASSAARAKPDALKHAQGVVENARADFKAAVKAGDTGSSEDIGRMPRGVLDPRVEVAIFSLAAGEISEPLETPKGYWIVKRIE